MISSIKLQRKSVIILIDDLFNQTIKKRINQVIILIDDLLNPTRKKWSSSTRNQIIVLMIFLNEQELKISFFWQSFNQKLSHWGSSPVTKHQIIILWLSCSINQNLIPILMMIFLHFQEIKSSSYILLWYISRNNSLFYMIDLSP